MTRYSTKIITKVIETEDGEVRKYQANKLGAEVIAKEWFKILPIITPMMGALGDSAIEEKEYGIPSQHKLQAAMLSLSSELDEEHFADLQEKLLGKLMFNGKDLEHWGEHFDSHTEDYLDVLVWLIKENFYDFFTSSRMIQPFVKKMKESILPTLNEKMQNVLGSLNQNTNDE